MLSIGRRYEFAGGVRAPPAMPIFAAKTADQGSGSFSLREACLRSFAQFAALMMAGLLLAGCMRSETPFLTGREAETPLPDALVLAGESDGMVKGIRADRQGDHYLMGDEGDVSAYRFVRLDGDPANGQTLYVVVQGNDSGPEAYYSLVGVSGDTLTIHSFDAGDIAAEIGVQVRKSAFDTVFETEDDLLAVFGAAADQLRAGRGETRHMLFRVIDMTNPAGKAEGERILEETAKAEAADKAARDAESGSD